MINWLDRTELLLGCERLKKLQASNVLVVGLGGVGAYAAEMICRAGVGKMTIADPDVVEVTNRNRQLTALESTSGLPKARVLGKRLLDIHPGLDLTVVEEFIRDERARDLLREQAYDYVVDSIDTLSPKVFLIYHSIMQNLKVVSSMGAGGKTDPSRVQVCDISQSYQCKLARVLRKRLSRLGVRSGFRVVFSPEEINEASVRLDEGQNKKSTVGTISYMPPLFGCYMGSEVITGLLDGKNK